MRGASSSPDPSAAAAAAMRRPSAQNLLSNPPATNNTLWQASDDSQTQTETMYGICAEWRLLLRYHERDITLTRNHFCCVVTADCNRRSLGGHVLQSCARPSASALCYDRMWALGAPGSQRGQRAPQGFLTPTAHAFQHVRQLISG